MLEIDHGLTEFTNGPSSKIWLRFDAVGTANDQQNGRSSGDTRGNARSAVLRRSAASRWSLAPTNFYPAMD